MRECVVWLDRAVPRTGSRSIHELATRYSRAGLLVHREALVLGGSVSYEHSTAEWPDRGEIGPPETATCCHDERLRACDRDSSGKP